MPLDDVPGVRMKPAIDLSGYIEKTAKAGIRYFFKVTLGHIKEDFMNLKV